MGQLKLFLMGRIPSKKNSRMIAARQGKRIISLPSENYNIWHRDKIIFLKTQPIPKAIDHCRIKIEFLFPDNRRADLSNKAESIMDLLVDAGILVDDNHKVCYDLHLISLGTSKKEPGAWVIINYEDNISPAS